ncbi:hypothetical protein HanXRQr2_Chr11g0475721 [Helianthus annuus]|uniref:Uncharacterized protein n=1 Tax=Helianthus annuus TaxID=4232 RepID=A0A9K3HLV3_HELAN|nr:hypothetical protein HanXRQr2_Chr11g0475721 [Helianthus annuus]KAJ0873969.1 hypothetical protein HanPSC8_Chr11g0458671 [Helianthus annuus]
MSLVIKTQKSRERENYMLTTWHVELFGSGLQVTLFSYVLLLLLVLQLTHGSCSKSQSLPSFLPITLSTSTAKIK